MARKFPVERRIWQTSKGVALVNVRLNEIKRPSLWLLFEGERYVDGWAVGAELSAGIHRGVVGTSVWRDCDVFLTFEERRPWWADIVPSPRGYVKMARQDIAFGPS